LASPGPDASAFGNRPPALRVIFIIDAIPHWGLSAPARLSPRPGQKQDNSRQRKALQRSRFHRSGTGALGWRFALCVISRPSSTFCGYSPRAPRPRWVPDPLQVAHRIFPKETTALAPTRSTSGCIATKRLAWPIGINVSGHFRSRDYRCPSCVCRSRALSPASRARRSTRTPKNEFAHGLAAPRPEIDDHKDPRQ